MVHNAECRYCKESQQDKSRENPANELLRFFRHPKKIVKARGAMKRLRAIAKTILRDIDRKFGDGLELHERYARKFYLFMRILLQERNTPNKIYSLHETDAYAINKGKDHKGYEYGTKASIVITKKSCIIIGVEAHKENIHDSKTLNEVIGNAHKNRTVPIEEAICDRGYRGVDSGKENRPDIGFWDLCMDF